MKLFIDTSNADKIIIKLNDQEYETAARKEKSQLILPFIVETLKNSSCTLLDLTEIEVAQGPGSFTGLRVGVAVAQTLGWSLKIPVNGQSMSQKNFVQINYDR